MLAGATTVGIISYICGISPAEGGVRYCAKAGHGAKERCRVCHCNRILKAGAKGVMVILRNFAFHKKAWRRGSDTGGRA